MNKKAIALALILAGVASANMAYAGNEETTPDTSTTTQAGGDVTAQAVATWSATAKKDTSSKLVVTPLGSLSFQYAEGVKGFNSQKGLFDVAVQGETEATAFKLTTRLLSNTLTAIDNSGSTLEVGVNYNGQKVDKEADTTLIDTTEGINGGNLNAIATGYNKSDRVTAQDAFAFSIIGATSDGKAEVTDYTTLPDGVWSGDVSVQFDATWTG